MKAQTIFFLLPAVAADFATVFPVLTDTCKQCLTKPYEACLPEKSASFVECICATQAQNSIQCMGGTTCDHGDDFAAASGWLTFCITNYQPVRDAYCHNTSYAPVPIPANGLTSQLCAAGSSSSSSTSKSSTSSTKSSSGPTTATSSVVTVHTTCAPSTTLKPVTTIKTAGPVVPTSTTKPAPKPVIVSGGVVNGKSLGLSLAVYGVVTALLWV